MIALGLLLIVLALVLGVGGLWLTASVSQPLALTAGLFGVELPPVTLFAFGMAAMGLLWLGWLLLRTGTKRSVRARRERRLVAREVRDRDSGSRGSAVESSAGLSAADRGDAGYAGSSQTRPRTD